MEEFLATQSVTSEFAAWHAPPSSSEGTHPPGPEWALVERIVTSRGFSKSPRLASFLIYICDRHLRGRTREITELQIGTRVFDRPKNYNPSEDNIVRTYARVLRKRLAEYFEGEGKHELLQISVPRGGYVPVFEPAPQSFKNIGMEAEIPCAAPPVFETRKVPFPIDSSWPSRRWLFVCIAAAFLFLLAAVYFVRQIAIVKAPTPAQLLWAQLFRRDMQSLIVPTDSGWGILQNVTHKPAHLSDYVNGLYFADSDPPAGMDARNFNDLRTQHYTSMVALDITNRLLHLATPATGQTSVRYPRDLRMDDLKRCNILLLGSVHANPWVELFEKDMNFRLKYDSQVDDSSVMNAHPAEGEFASYANEWNDPAHRTYGVIAYLPNLSGTGHVLIIEGLNMAATQAAADVLLDEAASSPILQGAVTRNGALRPFELLIETASIGVTPPRAHIAASRFY